MTSADLQLRILFLLSRKLQETEVTATARVEQLYADLFPEGPSQKRPGGLPVFNLLSAPEWHAESLRHAVYFIEEITAQYAAFYYDPRVIPVTYYRREKRIRRHLDQNFSAVFRQLQTQFKIFRNKELITEEPIYYLMQIVREKKFQKSRDGHVLLSVLKSRIHLDLSHRLNPEGSEEMRRVLLPHEIR